MQWSAEKNAGFSQTEPWIEVQKNYKTINTEVEGTKLVVLCNLCEEENKVVWQSEWDSYELLLGNYSDGKVDGTLRPYECKVIRSI